MGIAGVAGHEQDGSGHFSATGKGGCILRRARIFEREMREEKNRAAGVVLPHPRMSERQFVNRGVIKYAGF